MAKHKKSDKKEMKSLENRVAPITLNQAAQFTHYNTPVTNPVLVDENNLNNANNNLTTDVASLNSELKYQAHYGSTPLDSTAIEQSETAIRGDLSAIQSNASALGYAGSAGTETTAGNFMLVTGASNGGAPSGIGTMVATDVNQGIANSGGPSTTAGVEGLNADGSVPRRLKI